LRDLLNTLRRRYPLARVILSPTPVQGAEAPAGIVAALQQLNASVHPDVILLARGGGSIEDLWAFNDEGVARAIVASPAPVITGVGHEIDFTIADFAADLRAPTPTAAAELATPNQADLRVDREELLRRLRRSIAACLETFRAGLEAETARLQARSPLSRIRRDRQRLDDLSRRAGMALSHQLDLRRARLEGQSLRLSALNPQAIFRRGYALVTQSGGRVVRSVGQVASGEALDVRVSDGTFGVRVQDSGLEQR
jgi:exodeoxyribonuclease VII large subunit